MQYQRLMEHKLLTGGGDGDEIISYELYLQFKKMGYNIFKNSHKH